MRGRGIRMWIHKRDAAGVLKLSFVSGWEDVSVDRRGGG